MAKGTYGWLAMADLIQWLAMANRLNGYWWQLMAALSALVTMQKKQYEVCILTNVRWHTCILQCVSDS